MSFFRTPLQLTGSSSTKVRASTKIYYPQENHGFVRDETLIDAYSRTAAWFANNTEIMPLHPRPDSGTATGFPQRKEQCQQKTKEGRYGADQRVGLVSATTIVMGSMIGSGIFIVPADIARRSIRPR
jgi:hypothetical protein